MKLTNVRIKGFKNIKDVNIEINDRIAVLIADNGFGKSNLINAIEFAFEYICADCKKRKWLMSRREYVPIHKGVPADKFLADFMFTDDAVNKEKSVNYGFEFQWQSDKAPGAIEKEWLNYREEGRSKKYTRMIDRNIKAYYKSSRTGRCSTEINVSDDELVLNRLIYIEKLFYESLIQTLNHMTITVIRPEDILKQAVVKSVIAEEDSIKDINGINDLPRFLYQLKMQNPNRFSYIFSSMQLQFEDIEDIKVHRPDLDSIYGDMDGNVNAGSRGNTYYLTVTKKNLSRPIDYTRLSKGELYTLFLLSKYVAADIRGDVLIAIDEPECSIHPKQYDAHAQTIAPITMDDCSVLIASQAPFLVQYFDPKYYYIGRPGSNGVADFARIDRRKLNHLRKEAGNYGETSGVYVFDLLSGSDDEIEILKGYLEP